MAHKAPRDGDQRRVLVVDDHVGICAFLTEVLDAEGYAVQAAYNGRDALELLRDWDIDLILLDLMLPGMDVGAFRRTQLADPRLAAIPLVVMSTMLIPDNLAVELAPAAILLKPYSLNVLVETVSQLTS